MRFKYQYIILELLVYFLRNSVQYIILHILKYIEREISKPGSYCRENNKPYWNSIAMIITKSVKLSKNYLINILLLYSFI